MLILREKISENQCKKVKNHYKKVALIFIFFRRSTFDRPKTRQIFVRFTCIFLLKSVLTNVNDMR